MNNLIADFLSPRTVMRTCRPYIQPICEKRRRHGIDDDHQEDPPPRGGRSDLFQCPGPASLKQPVRQ